MEAFDELVTCPKCGSRYGLTCQRIIARDDDDIRCRFCGTVIYSWSEAKIWSATLIEPGPEVEKK